MTEEVPPTTRHLYAGRDSRAMAWHDLRAMAHRRLPAFVSEYVEGGAEDERTLAANRAAFEGCRCRNAC